MIAIKLIGINSFKTEVLKVRMDEITIGQVIHGECRITLSKLAIRQSEAVSSLQLIAEYCHAHLAEFECGKYHWMKWMTEQMKEWTSERKQNKLKDK